MSAIVFKAWRVIRRVRAGSRFSAQGSQGRPRAGTRLTNLDQAMDSRLKRKIEKRLSAACRAATKPRKRDLKK